MNGCFTVQDYLTKLGNGGDSSSGLVYFPIEDYFPDAPIVIVQRDIDEVYESCIKLGIANEYTYDVLKDMQERLDKMKGLRVNFHDLDLEEIWDHLIGHGFNKEEAVTMSKQNIQKLDKGLDVDAFIGFLGDVSCQHG